MVLDTSNLRAFLEADIRPYNTQDGDLRCWSSRRSFSYLREGPV